MVDRDLRGRGIRDERVLAAFERVDRARFVPSIERDKAYDDRALQLTHGQTISQPYMVALMLEALQLRGGEKVLEIGTGSGYQTALLAEICAEVWTVERIEYLATTAEDRLLDLGYRNIRFKLGDGSNGWPEGAPYDRIVVSAACPNLPQPLLEQLGEDGLLAAPVGVGDHQDLTVAVKRGGRIDVQKGIACVFVKLIGDHGYAAPEG